MTKEVKEAKQVIIVRKDLNMRKGKIASQAAHASMAALLNQGTISGTKFTIDMDKPTQSWLEGRFKKITVYVNSELELVTVYQKAKDAGLTVSLITDAGLTEFNGVPTKTAVGIGPNWSEDIDKITGSLPLF